MTTDPFTTAATEKAASVFTGDWDYWNQEPVDDYGASEAERKAFVSGAEWARDHLATQEPTEEEIEAAARTIRKCDPARRMITLPARTFTKAPDHEQIGGLRCLLPLCPCDRR